MRFFLAWTAFVFVLASVLFKVTQALDWSRDDWRIAAVALFIGSLSGAEPRVRRWWQNRRLRRYLDAHPIARRADPQD